MTKKTISTKQTIIKRLKSHWEWFLFPAVLISIIFWQTKDALSTQGNVKVPNFVLPSIQGELIDSSKFDGKPTLYYFFAPWCSVCDLSIENIQTLKDELNANEINVIAIALDYQSKEEVEEFIRNNKFPGIIALGSQQQKYDFQIKGYPTYYIANRSGIIKWASIGYSTSIGINTRINWTD
ncbi:MAG: TlpA family protein disulfide reductase [Gammaproteobacteria bacterium]|nr:TlpA family protein disulfide reductase [Gammaproteobacteria bacterium]